MLKFTHPFFYHIEGAAMYVQSKIWGKYATYTWDLNLHKLILVISNTSLTYLTYILTALHPFYVALVYLALGVLCLLSYYSDEQYQKTDDYEILSDFNKLSGRTRFIYLFYVFGFCLLLPLLLVLFFLLYRLI